ncbi:hypothetical protein C2S51_014944 [Perilla frutescens var. frutescens]|nr:hypothetical protein C2S51_014944 [Perilla frutescens var. frutescens]
MSRNSKMKQDLLASLPPEVTIDIFSRLPVRSIICCKCVCKSWLDLIKSNEFVNSHLSKSVSGLAHFRMFEPSMPYKFLEFVENSMYIVFTWIFPHHHIHIHSSVNGLLFLLKLHLRLRTRNLFICNPITRDYIKLPCPRKYPSSKRKALLQADTFGFGVSKKSGQYKVVRLFHECTTIKVPDGGWKTVDTERKCEVYTLGTRSWRSIEPGVLLRYDYYDIAATFLNGNLHWWGHVLHDDSMWISCFDLETELFTIFSGPPIHGRYSAISALEECSVFCDNSYYDERNEIVIWFMNEYGDDKSWIKKCIVNKSWPPADEFIRSIRPIKVLEDGDILIAQVGRSRLLCYSSRTKTIKETDYVEWYGFNRYSAVSYTPSFVPLNTFKTKKVRSF